MPPTADGAPLSQFHDPRYAGLPPELRPRSERLKDGCVSTVVRTGIVGAGARNSSPSACV